jgi:hypothetical protein
MEKSWDLLCVLSVLHSLLSYFSKSRAFHLVRKNTTSDMVIERITRSGRRKPLYSSLNSERIHELNESICCKRRGGNKKVASDIGKFANKGIHLLPQRDFCSLSKTIKFVPRHKGYPNSIRATDLFFCVNNALHFLLKRERILSPYFNAYSTVTQVENKHRTLNDESHYGATLPLCFSSSKTQQSSP